jgi:hypothetical protein
MGIAGNSNAEVETYHENAWFHNGKLPGCDHLLYSSAVYFDEKVFVFGKMKFKFYSNNF